MQLLCSPVGCHQMTITQQQLTFFNKNGYFSHSSWHVLCFPQNNKDNKRDIHLLKTLMLKKKMVAYVNKNAFVYSPILYWITAWCLHINLYVYINTCHVSLNKVCSTCATVCLSFSSTLVSKQMSVYSTVFARSFDRGCDLALAITACSLLSSPFICNPMPFNTINFPLARHSFCFLSLFINSVTHSFIRSFVFLCQSQEVLKLTILDLVFTAGNVIVVDFLRGLCVRYTNVCCCWDLEKQFVSGCCQ